MGALIGVAIGWGAAWVYYRHPEWIVALKDWVDGR